MSGHAIKTAAWRSPPTSPPSSTTSGAGAAACSPSPAPASPPRAASPPSAARRATGWSARATTCRRRWRRRPCSLRRPDEVWRWYLYRFGVCAAAEPNAGHHALVRLDRALGERFHLVTQNIDGLHLRAGASPERTSCIHGDAAFVRCAAGCVPGRLPQPDMGRRDRRDPVHRGGPGGALLPALPGVAPAARALVRRVLRRGELPGRHRAGGGAARPTCCWWWGRAAPPTCPCRSASWPSAGASPIVDVNPEANPFSELAEASARGFWLRGASGRWLPEVVERWWAKGQPEGRQATRPCCHSGRPRPREWLPLPGRERPGRGSRGPGTPAAAPGHQTVSTSFATSAGAPRRMGGPQKPVPLVT